MNQEIKQYLQAGRKNLIMIYFLYLCGIVAPLLPAIGVVLSYINKDTRNKDWASHYLFLYRTFYIGFALVVVSYITEKFFVGPFIYTAVMIWVTCRVIMGLKYLHEERAYPEPLTLWIK